MGLNWTLHPKHTNVQLAQSAAYQYRLQEWNDGQAELTVQHRGDRPSAKAVKNFVYKSRKAAFGGAQRFEDKHGYAEAPRHIILRPFSAPIRRHIRIAQDRAQGKLPIPDEVDDVSTYLEHATEDYDALCDELLCCRVYDCFNRDEFGNGCTEHRSGNTTTED